MANLELNLDGLVGPTHNYAGLAQGNLPSQSHAGQMSFPREAALQGLAKMKLLMDLGVPQAVMPPQPRPRLDVLRRFGFTGSDADVLRQAAKQSPRLLAAVWSASSMWTANAATVSPAADTEDGKVHFTPANLQSHLHRSIETQHTAWLLKQIFSDPRFFAHHEALPCVPGLGDEGAANHTCLAGTDAGASGLELFVHGSNDEAADTRQPAGAAAKATRYIPRQTLAASQAIARLHRLDPQRVLHAQQQPSAIDAGVFHNDVICVGHGNVLLCHEQAFVNQHEVLSELRRRFEQHCAGELILIEVKESELPLKDAVASYLFNSQLVTTSTGELSMIAPVECTRIESARRFLHKLVSSGSPISDLHIVDLRQSMRNGGGPACLRLRVPLTDASLAAMHQGVLLTPALLARLRAWVDQHYREQLQADDLADPALMEESAAALAELHEILGLPPVH